MAFLCLSLTSHPAHPDSCVPPRRLQHGKSFHCNCWMVKQLFSLLGGGGGVLPDLPGITIVIQGHSIP